MTRAHSRSNTDTRQRAAAGKTLAAVTLGAVCVVQTAGAASFDCAKAGTPVERMICGERTLERLDERMAELFERARKAAGADEQALLAAQRAWLETRNACADTDCLRHAYRERIAALGGGPPQDAGEVVREVVDGGSAVRLADKRGDLDVEAIYPLLPGDDATTRALNAGIERAFRQPLEDFRQQYAAFLADGDSIHTGPPWAFSLGYEKVYTSDTLISIDGGGYQYTGGAHGSALYLPLVLEREHGKRLEPEDLFRPGSSWLPLLAEQSRQALREQEPFSTDPSLADADWFQEGTAPTADNYALLRPTAEGIRVTFGQYQVGPYAIGDFRVTVPYDALAEVLAPGLFPDQVRQQGATE